MTPEQERALAESLTLVQQTVLHRGCSAMWLGESSCPRHWWDVVSVYPRASFKTIEALQRRGLVEILELRVKGFPGKWVVLTLLGLRVRGWIDRR